MAADHLYLAAERAALTQRLVSAGTGGRRAQGGRDQAGRPDTDRAVLQALREIDQWLDTHGLSGIKASSAAAVATRAPKDHRESEESVCAVGAELAEQGVGERQLAEVCSGDAAVRPAGRSWTRCWTRWPARGLTGQCDTFTPDRVVDALAKRPGRPLR